MAVVARRSVATLRVTGQVAIAASTRVHTSLDCLHYCGFDRVVCHAQMAAPSPLTPDEFDEVLKKLPRDPQNVDLFKKDRGHRPAPAPLHFPLFLPDDQIIHSPLLLPGNVFFAAAAACQQKICPQLPTLLCKTQQGYKISYLIPSGSLHGHEH